MSIIICPECKNNVSDKASSCPHCGYPIYMQIHNTAKKIKCNHCDNMNDAYNTSCSFCGAPITPEPEDNSTTYTFDTPPQQTAQNIMSNMFNTFNTPNAANTVNIVVSATPKNKWLAFILCLFFGYWGAHKFYEGKKGRGLVYLFTFGLFGIGWIVDIFTLLGKPNPYYISNL